MKKQKQYFFSKWKVNKEIKLKLYGQDIGRVSCFKFVGVWFDEKLKFKMHIEKIIDKCKKVQNVMRCLVDKDWGAERLALKSIYTGLI